MKIGQELLMLIDPAYATHNPYPSHAKQWRAWHGTTAWLFNPWTKSARDPKDIGSDPFGVLIVPPDEEMLASAAQSSLTSDAWLNQQCNYAQGGK